MNKLDFIRENNFQWAMRIVVGEINSKRAEINKNVRFYIVLLIFSKFYLQNLKGHAEVVWVNRNTPIFWPNQSFRFDKLVDTSLRSCNVAATSST